MQQQQQQQQQKANYAAIAGKASNKPPSETSVKPPSKPHPPIVINRKQPTPGKIVESTVAPVLSSQGPSAVMMMKSNSMLYLAGIFVGLLVQVDTAEGVVYEGIMHALKFTVGDQGGVSVVLGKAKVISGGVSGMITEQLVIEDRYIVQVSAGDVDFDVGAVSSTNVTAKTGDFQVDTAISAAAGGASVRQLEKWMPDSNDGASSPSGVDYSLNPRGSKNWDQFATNERLFGVRAEFNEDAYTTKLNKDNSQDYKKREKEADRIAKEIERSVSTNKHMKEERGQSEGLHDDVDEEDRYGAVVRGPNAYIPPALRTAKALVVDSPAEKNPTQEKAQESKKQSELSHTVKQAPEPTPTSTELADNPPPKTKLNPNAFEFKISAPAFDFQPVQQALPDSAVSVFGTRLANNSVTVRDFLIQSSSHNTEQDINDERMMLWPYSKNYSYQDPANFFDDELGAAAAQYMYSGYNFAPQMSAPLFAGGIPTTSGNYYQSVNMQYMPAQQFMPYPPPPMMPMYNVFPPYNTPGAPNFASQQQSNNGHS